MSCPASEQDGSPHHIHYEQRRIGHICAILVRNLSLRPTRDRALRTINSKRPGASSRYHTTSDDTDLTLSLARSNSKTKAKGKASGSHARGRRASWDLNRSGSSEDDQDDERVANFPSASNPPLRNKLGRSTSYGRQDSRGRSAFLSEHRRTSDYDLHSSSSLHAPSSDGTHNNDASPRPILKRSSSTRDGRDARVPNSPSSSFLDELGTKTNMLSRSDSRSSSRSSHTIRRPPHRSRTTSMTSSHSVRSVRFDESQVKGSPGERRQSRMTGRLHAASRYALFSQKSLAQMMKDRMLECFVELSRLSTDQEGNKGESRESIFYRTSRSKPGLHHSWGYQGGDPITPERDFKVDSEQIVPLHASTLRIKVWARSQKPEANDSADTAAGQAEAHWKLVCHTSVDLRDLTPVTGKLQDTNLSLPPNSILLGLAPGANSLSGRADLVTSSDSTSGPSNDDKGDTPKLGRKASEREAERTRHVLENIVYYAIPLNPIAAETTNGINGASVPRATASKSDKEQAGRDDGLGRSQTPRRRASMEVYASDPENAPIRKSAPTSPNGKTATNTSLPAQPLTSDTRRQRRKVFEDEQRRAIELSLRQTKMMPSYDLDEAKLLARKQGELQSLMAEVQELRQRDGSLLRDRDGWVQMRLRREKQKSKLGAVRQMAIDELDDLQQRRTELKERKEALKARRDAMHATRHLFEIAGSACDKLREEVNELHHHRGDLSLQVHTQQASLLRDLEIIFPIELSDASSLLFSICGLPLPNDAASLPQSELTHEEKKWKELVKTHYPAATRPIFHAFDDNTVSSAFGLVAQLVVLLSTYLATPIHYPLATAGSRAVVQDGISLMSGPRAFPLYAKGMERYRYEYAAYLLNKDVEQLMNVHSVTVIDIRHTLPNLKNLMVTVAAAPPQSQATRKSHIGRTEIALRSVKSAASLAAPQADQEAGGEGIGGPKAGLGLGLGLPQTNGERGKQDNVVTTRVLGRPSKAAPTTATATNGAIASVSRALSYFSGSTTR